jgi:broad specificity phosphatase PhoE
VLYVTHAEVAIDPAVPVPDWALSPGGRARHRAFARRMRGAGLGAVYSSPERKAREAAAILAAEVALPVVVAEDLHENDRSATGYLPPAEFEAVADAFFARPDESVRGWERAADAQARIVGAVEAILRGDPAGGVVAIVGHGGVGALLMCRVLDEPIGRRRDQPGRGGGNCFAFSFRDGEGWRLLHGWTDIAGPGPLLAGSYG